MGQEPCSRRSPEPWGSDESGSGGPTVARLEYAEKMSGGYFLGRNARERCEDAILMWLEVTR